ncbi:hypothetical protein ANO11243_071740 [Dothideomycetidae sp. 11243]|nr:hypothetical protein ANO11243_071740 [fungal sp. No.11243]
MEVIQAVEAPEAKIPMADIDAMETDSVHASESGRPSDDPEFIQQMCSWRDKRPPANIFGIDYAWSHLPRKDHVAKKRLSASSSHLPKPAFPMLKHKGVVIGPDAHFKRYNGYWRQLPKRKSFTSHVYCLVSWFDRPQDLATGPKPYHGKYELIASTTVDCINADCIQQRTSIVHWDENEQELPNVKPGQFYWRQTRDHASGKVSTPKRICYCDTPRNPDERVVSCTSCGQSMHEHCAVPTTPTHLLETLKLSDSRHTSPSDSLLGPARADSSCGDGWDDCSNHDKSPVKAGGKTAVQQPKIYCMQCKRKGGG